MTKAIPREAYRSEEWFAREMRALSAHTWQFFCVQDDLANANDWVRRSIYGTDVFVQNFNGEIRGYHNICSHRGFPLRREPRGNGTVQCGFHGWVYNREGVPTGIPRNQELFQLSREAQSTLALDEVRVAVIGRFVFVALEKSVPPIEEYLGRYVDILRVLSTGMRTLRLRHESEMQANWKLCFEVTLDDYHLQMVHPSTFGAGTPFPVSKFLYGQEGMHSYLWRRRDDHWTFASFWDDLARGNYDYTGYKIHQIFPNLLISTTPYNVFLIPFRPNGVASTIAEDLLFDVHGTDVDAPGMEAGWKVHRQVQLEDRAVSEAQQQAMKTYGRTPTFGRLEERVAWFQKAYCALLDRPTT